MAKWYDANVKQSRMPCKTHIILNEWMWKRNVREPILHRVQPFSHICIFFRRHTHTNIQLGQLWTSFHFKKPMSAHFHNKREIHIYISYVHIQQHVHMTQLSSVNWAMIFTWKRYVRHNCLNERYKLSRTWSNTPMSVTSANLLQPNCSSTSWTVLQWWGECISFLECVPSSNQFIRKWRFMYTCLM